MEKLEFTKEIKENWLTALKSGDYVQGKYKFEQVDEGITQHCCLGVLCVVLRLPATDEDRGGNWTPIEEIIPNNELLENLYMTNDNKYDGKYTAVIPLIEAMKTID